MFPRKIVDKNGNAINCIETEDELQAKANALELEGHQSYSWVKAVLRSDWFDKYINPWEANSDYSFDDWIEEVWDTIDKLYERSIRINDPELEDAADL